MKYGNEVGSVEAKRIAGSVLREKADGEMKTFLESFTDPMLAKRLKNWRCLLPSSIPPLLG